MAEGDDLNSRKGKGGRGGSGEAAGKGRGGKGEIGECGKGNILVKRKGDMGESRVTGCSKKTTFKRKQRSCSQGIYGTKPDPNAKPTVHFTSKTSIEEPAAKRTLGFIAKSYWDEKTVTQTMAEREPYFNDVVKAFKEYYKYPKDWEKIGDSVVKEHLKKNMKSYFNKIKERFEIGVQPLRDAGYPDEEIPWDAYRPHYIAPRAWLSLLKYWKLPVFMKRSDQGKEARKQMEITARTGAIPYTERRKKMDDERETMGQMPLTEEEFMDYVYNPLDPAVIALKEKIKNVRASVPESSSQILGDDQPPSPQTQRREIQRKNILVMLQARPPKKGKTILHPHETVAQLVGEGEAAKYYASSQKIQDSPPEVDLPDTFYSIMSKILKEVGQMVRSLPMREVMQPVLDVEVRNLATAAFPDPDQVSQRTHYVRAATGLLREILEVNDKVIVEVTRSKKEAPVVENIVPDEDEDPYADHFPLG